MVSAGDLLPTADSREDPPQRRHPAAQVVHLGLPQLDSIGRGQPLQAHQGFAVHRQRARRESALDLEMGEVLGQLGPQRHAVGSNRCSAALASSPTRARNSVPMSAL